MLALLNAPAGSLAHRTSSLLSLELPNYVQTPGGRIHHSCVWTVEDVEAAGKEAKDLPLTCDAEKSIMHTQEHSRTAGRGGDEANETHRPIRQRTVSTFERQTYAMDVHAKNASFWTSFTADWTVPKLPSSSAGEQVVYFWPGFKSQEPEMGFPVLQPVMQYGQAGSKKWQLQSWYVHGEANVALTGKAVELSPGDKISSFMSYDGKTKMWTVSGTNLASGESSVMKISRAKLGNYDFEWAMLVCETVKFDNDCPSLPADKDGLMFTGVSLNGIPGANWTTRVGLDDCAEGIRTNNEGKEVALSWEFRR